MDNIYNKIQLMIFDFIHMINSIYSSYKRYNNYKNRKTFY